MIRKMAIALLVILSISIMNQASAVEYISYPIPTSYVNIVSCAVANHNFFALNQRENGYEALLYSQGENEFTVLDVPQTLADPYDCVFFVADGDRLFFVSFENRTIHLIEEASDRKSIIGNHVSSFEANEAFYEYDEFGEKYFHAPYDAVICDNKVYCLFKTFERGRETAFVMAIDLDNGNVMRLDVDSVYAISSYHDQQIVYLRKAKDDHLDLLCYDTGKGASSIILADIGTSDNITRVLYSEERDLIIWQDQQRIMGLQKTGAVEQIGYNESPYLDRLELLDDHAICVTNNKVSCIPMLFDEESPSLTIYGTGNIAPAIKLLQEQIPSIQIYFQNASSEDSAETLMNRILSRDESADLYIMPVDSLFLQMKRKGYCADLSAIESVVSNVNNMHFEIIDAVSEDNSLYALPLEIVAWGWQINLEIMDEMGLSFDDLPNSLEELCTFISRWDQEWVYDFPEYMPVEDWTDFRAELLDAILNTYMIQSLSNDQDIDFLSPEFQRVMSVYETMTTDNVERLANDGTDRRGLLSDNKQIIGSFDIASSDKYEYHPMPLCRDNDYNVDARLLVIFINPNSKKIDLAVQFLQSVVQCMPAKQQHCLFRDCVDPVENPQFEQQQAEYQQRMDAINIQLENATGYDLLTLEEERKWLQMKISMLEEYIISPTEISYYQSQIVPYIFLPASSAQDIGRLTESSSYIQCINQYLDGLLSCEQMTRRLNQIIEYMNLEQ